MCCSCLKQHTFSRTEPGRSMVSTGKHHGDDVGWWFIRKCHFHGRFSIGGIYSILVEPWLRWPWKSFCPKCPNCLRSAGFQDSLLWVFLKMGIHKTMGFTSEKVWNGPSLDDLGYSHFGKPPNCFEPSKEHMSGFFLSESGLWNDGFLGSSVSLKMRIGSMMQLSAAKIHGTSGP